jgi:putative cell wall-binding protein
LTFASVLAPTSAAFAAPQHAAAASNVQRVAGATRLETAIAASVDRFPTAGSAQAVVLARSDNFPDALAGGPLAGKVGGPLLLTSSGSLDTAVANEIKRVAPKGATVYILGGTKALSANVESAVTTLGDTPKRLQGSDRFGTAVAIADEMGDPTTVFEATGLNFPDALAGVPAAIKAGGAILLTNGKQQATETATYLAAHPGGTHYALGGPAAAADPAATALIGDDRFATAVDVAEEFFGDATTVGVATGFNFPDALAAGPDLAAKNAPLLLVPSSGALADAPTYHLLAVSDSTTKALVFGGTVSVGDDVVTQVGNLVGAYARAQAADSTPAYTGNFGVLAQKVTVKGLTGNSTVVADASTGDVTKYFQGSSTTTIPAGVAPRAQLAALQTDDLEAFKSAVNSLFADYDSQLGLTGDADTLFLLNAEQILLNPVAPASIRFETYVALGVDDEGAFVRSGVKDSMGRVGIEVYAPLGVSDTDQSEISLIFDPVTLLPLEDTVFDTDGSVLTRTTVLSLTTAATAPGDPYTS